MSILQKFPFYNISTNLSTSVLLNPNTVHTKLLFHFLHTYSYILSSHDANHTIVHTWALECSGCVHQNAQQCW